MLRSSTFGGLVLHQDGRLHTDRRSLGGDVLHGSSTLQLNSERTTRERP
jgi:hypothetical protein